VSPLCNVEHADRVPNCVQGSDYGSAMPTSKGNTPNTMTPQESATVTPGMSSRGSRASSTDEPRAPASTPDPARPVSFDFGQGPPRGPRASMDAGSDLAPGSELNSPVQSRPTSLDYGPNAPPPSLAGRQHPSGMWQHFRHRLGLDMCMP
jgi:hypothetical protein